MFMEQGVPFTKDPKIGPLKSEGETYDLVQDTISTIINCVTQNGVTVSETVTHILLNAISSLAAQTM